MIKSAIAIALKASIFILKINGASSTTISSEYTANGAKKAAKTMDSNGSKMMMEYGAKFSSPCPEEPRP